MTSESISHKEKIQVCCDALRLCFQIFCSLWRVPVVSAGWGSYYST